MARSRFSLALMFLVFFLVNVVLVTLAAWYSRAGSTWSLLPDDVSMGVRLLILLVLAVAIWGVDRILHRELLEAGVSPVDTTGADLAFMVHLVLTASAVLFLADSSWLVFAFFTALLFIFTVIILKRLLESSKRWIVWIVSAVLLAAVTVVLTMMMLGGEATA